MFKRGSAIMESELIFYTCVLMLVPIIIFFAGAWMKNLPPKERNTAIGFRTRRTMISQESWDYAQVLSGKMMIRLCFLLIPAMIILILALRYVLNMDFFTIFIIGSILEMASLFVCILLLDREVGRFNKVKGYE